MKSLFYIKNGLFGLMADDSEIMFLNIIVIMSKPI
jgi:hypothetical protein